MDRKQMPPRSLSSVALAAAVITLGLAGVAGAQPPERFDLACTGVRTQSGAGGASVASPWEGRYRIDLRRQSYCSGDCAMVDKIARVEGDAITLTDKQMDYRGDPVKLLSQLDRRTGKFNLAVTPAPNATQAMAQRIEATCTAQRFSGFPTGW
jgi:hypothetical protein